VYDSCNYLRPVAENSYLFGESWVSYSCRYMKAIWQPYKALWEHFREARADDPRSTAEIAILGGRKKT
jgi:hypothetical protein